MLYVCAPIGPSSFFEFGFGVFLFFYVFFIYHFWLLPTSRVGLWENIDISLVHWQQCDSKRLPLFAVKFLVPKAISRALDHRKESET
jgi:hypothetical protein